MRRSLNSVSVVILLTLSSHAYAELSGQVRTPDAKPVSGAIVTLLNASANKSIVYSALQGTELTDIRGYSATTKTDGDGKFQLPDPEPGAYLVVTGPGGFAAIQANQLSQNYILTVSRWVRVSGLWLNHGRPMASQRMALNLKGEIRHWVRIKDAVSTDANGNFVFAAVPSTNVSICWEVPISSIQPRPAVDLELLSVDLERAGSAELSIVTNGRVVTGRLVSGANTEDISGFSEWNVSLDPDLPSRPKPPVEIVGPEAIASWYNDWDKTDAGKRHAKAQRDRRQATVDQNGGFRAEAVAPGKYLLRAYVFGPNGITAVVKGARIEVPDGEAQYSVGDFPYETTATLRVGQEAPGFLLQSLNGQPLSLSDFRGKYVLIDFWAVWCGACVDEMANLKKVYDAYGADPRFALISLSLDNDIAVTRAFVKQHGTGEWHNAFLGKWSADQVHRAYNVYGIPEILLVGPDGRIVAMQLRGERIKTAVSEALRR